MNFGKVAAIIWITTATIWWSTEFVKAQQNQLLDTINQVTSDGTKQWWHVITEYGRKIQEWKYMDGKKVWLRTKYYATGNKESEITYVSNNPIWSAKFYYPNGNIKEEGNRQLNKWVGNYRFYYENGQLAYNRNHDFNGKREWTQEYFRENGNIKIVGNWVGWREEWELSSFYEDGSLQAKRYFDKWKIDPATTVEYEKWIVHDPLAKKYNEKPELEKFNGTWQHTFYTAEKKPLKTGYFKDWQLVTGKRFEYDTEWHLRKTFVYINGKLTETINH